MKKKLQFLAIFALTVVGTCYGQINTITLQPDASTGIDAWIHERYSCDGTNNFANINHGSVDKFSASAWTYRSTSASCDSGTVRSFIRFDQLLGSIPAGANILNAELHLFGTFSGEGTGHSSFPGSPFQPDNILEIGRVLAGWGENTITWNNRPGVDYTLTHPSSTQRYGEDIQVDVTTIVSQMVSSGTNHGFAIKLEDEIHYRSWHFASSDMPDPARHPALVITYAECSADFTYCFNTADNAFTFSHSGAGYHQWDFSEGYSAEGSSVSLTFAEPGMHEVCLFYQGEEVECEKCITICITEDQVGEGGIIRERKEEAPEQSTTEQSSSSILIHSLYPNPASSQLNIQLSSSGKQTAEVILTDVNGRTMFKKSLPIEGKNHQVVNLELPDLAKGLYIVSIKDGMDKETAEKLYIE